MIFSYIRRQIFSALLWSSVILIGLLWLTQSLRFLEFIVNYNVSLRIYFALIIFLIPDLVSLSLPICGVISAIWIYYRLIVQHEFLAMQAVGFSTLSLARPIVMMSSFITVFCLILNLWIAPCSFRIFRDFEHQIRSTLSRVFLRPGVFTSFKGLTIYSDQHTKKNDYKIVLIDLPGEHPSILISELGHFNDRVFTLEHGYRHTHNKKTYEVETFLFDELVYDLSNFIESHQSRLIKPHERPIGELLNPDPKTNPIMIKNLLLEGHQKILMPFLSLIDMMFIILFFLCKSSTRRRFQKRRLYSVLLSVMVTHLGFYSFLNICIKKDISIFVPYISFLALFLILVGFSFDPEFFYIKSKLCNKKQNQKT